MTFLNYQMPVPPQKSDTWFKKSHYFSWVFVPKISRVTVTLHRADARCYDIMTARQDHPLLKQTLL